MFSKSKLLTFVLFICLLSAYQSDSATCVNNSWLLTSTTNAPAARYVHTAVWTGTEMIVWGGFARLSPSLTQTGGRYNPATDTWTATSTQSAPAGRYGHTAVWTASKMIVWGGFNSSNVALQEEIIGKIHFYISNRALSTMPFGLAVK